LFDAPDQDPVITHVVTYDNIWQTEQQVLFLSVVRLAAAGRGGAESEGGGGGGGGGGGEGVLLPAAAAEHDAAIQRTTVRARASKHARGLAGMIAWEGEGREEEGGAVAGGWGWGWGRAEMEGPGGTA
jgi:hypothetical protein